MALEEVTTDAATMLIPVEISPYAFVEHLARNCTYEELLEVIIAIDEEMADWDFTRMIISYAKEQKRLLKAEEEDRF